MIRIVEPGALTTVQDAGRSGALRYGIPPSGPMDHAAFVLANRLVGNADGAAALETTLIGPRFEVQVECAIAVTGATVPVTVNGREAPMWATIACRAGDVVRVGQVRAGVRSYVAFAGGVDVPPVLGSRSTYLRGRLGGLGGRQLRDDDRLLLGRAANPPRARAVRATAVPRPEADPELRVVLGPQADRFTADGIATLLGEPYQLLSESDRMGARFGGPRIAHARGHDVISDGIALGSIQVPGDGQPIVLLVDRQSTGGYAKIATVCSFDVSRLAQVQPRRHVRFRAVTVAEAHRLRAEWWRALDTALEPE